MRFVFQPVNLRSADRFDRWVEQCLRQLLPLLEIEEARIRLAYNQEASPAFHASAHLVIPGPDIRAEAVDHTARTALERLLVDLQARALDRAARRERRHTRVRPPRGFGRLVLFRA
ncbi:MAG TPA: hypothetical protein VHE61_15450 [Opitutaceae bacterium]|nr:hypothetical protein [Opitutaceae bacterium]